MNLRLRRILVAWLGIQAAWALPVAWSQAQKALPKWTPAEERVKQLAAETKSDGWAIRPPRDAQNRVTKDPDETRTTWGRGASALVVTKSGVPFEAIHLDQAHQAMLELLKSRLKNLKNAPPERGLINGKTFVRARFSAEGMPGVTGKTFGFVYATIDGTTLMVITGFGSAATIEDLEASAQTFRILK